MTTDRHTLRRMTMALAVAYLLVLQALLGGMATGAHAGSLATVDAFGQVLCLTGHQPPASPSAPAHHTPDCCTTGCQISALATLPPLAAGVAAPLPVVAGPARLPADAAVAAGLQRSPKNARAPPLA
ncbi:hypothetical protein FHS55_002394 [Angulomicrobium tetraedrale]|uniref:DUF2946 domain-containing protein n=1 Tax=Ancylobacter tetraedralis TaxID=217068 RepID=A0A839ZAP3_9HYPH|nr:hypothetical protein [Ancylobacter tetraedralis]MBB3771785.1 hypothetical protein [Ancylobacter tetraedralis]